MFRHTLDSIYRDRVRPRLFEKFEDPEEAHEYVVGYMRGLIGRTVLRMLYGQVHDDRLVQHIGDTILPNPCIIAAGFDKKGQLRRAMKAIGAGGMEVGSVPPLPQPGNPRPRIWRVNENGEEGIINYMGLNSIGAEAVRENLHRDVPGKNFLTGISIVSNTSSNTQGQEKVIQDHLDSAEILFDDADYFAINISCPNVKKDEKMKSIDGHKKLIAEFCAFITRTAEEKQVTAPPVFVKFSHDMALEDIPEYVHFCDEVGVYGYIVANTSGEKRGLPNDHPLKNKQGGYSGPGLSEHGLKLVQTTREHTKNFIIASAGINSADKAISFLKRGANAFELFTGLIYEGPGLPRNINEGIVRDMEKEGHTQLRDYYIS